MKLFPDKYESTSYWSERIRLELYGMVKEYLTKSRLTKSDLSQRLGISKSVLSKMLNGYRDLRISMIVNIALACGKIPVITFIDKKELNQD